MRSALSILFMTLLVIGSTALGARELDIPNSTELGFGESSYHGEIRAITIQFSNSSTSAAYVLESLYPITKNVAYKLQQTLQTTNNKGPRILDLDAVDRFNEVYTRGISFRNKLTEKGRKADQVAKEEEQFEIIPTIVRMK